MRKVIFLMSHFGSGSSDLVDILCSDPSIDGYRTGFVYDHPDRMLELTKSPHKRDDVRAVYLDELLENRQFACRSIIDVCKFVFLFRSASTALACILEERPEWTLAQAAMYYRYRLRGMYEYAIRTGGVVLSWDDVAAGRLDDLEGYLGVRLSRPELVAREGLSGDVVEECQAAYDRYMAITS